MHDCLAPHQPLRLPVAPRPDGRGRSIIDFGIQSGPDLIRVEVKSPYAARPEGEGAFWSGDYKHLIEGSLDEANRQFSHDHTNVLMLVPLVEFPILAGRGPFVRAFYGDERLVFTIDRTTGHSIGEPEARFITDGRFMKRWPLVPRFTRVGAAVTLRESIREYGDGDDFRVEIARKMLVLHNPNSERPVPTGLWGDTPQFIADGDVMRWTDGKPVLGD